MRRDYRGMSKPSEIATILTKALDRAGASIIGGGGGMGTSQITVRFEGESYRINIEPCASQVFKVTPWGNPENVGGGGSVGPGTSVIVGNPRPIPGTGPGGGIKD